MLSRIPGTDHGWADDQGIIYTDAPGKPTPITLTKPKSARSRRQCRLTFDGKYQCWKVADLVWMAFNGAFDRNEYRVYSDDPWDDRLESLKITEKSGFAYEFCPHGHKLIPANTYEKRQQKVGSSTCKACYQARNNLFHAGATKKADPELYDMFFKHLADKKYRAIVES